MGGGRVGPCMTFFLFFFFNELLHGMGQITIKKKKKTNPKENPKDESERERGAERSCRVKPQGS